MAAHLYEVNYTTFWKRQNFSDSKNISGYNGLGNNNMSRLRYLLILEIKGIFEE